MLDGHLDELLAEGSVGVNTPLRRRPDVDSVLLVGPDEACLEFHGKRVRISVAGSLGGAVRPRNRTGRPPPQICPAKSTRMASWLFCATCFAKDS